jgi:hypothetical protein
VKKVMLIALCVLVMATLALAQNPTYTQGTGITGIDKLGAHQNGGRGCVGCHAPHSGARGNGGNAGTGAVETTDVATGNFALWGQDLSPLYSKTLAFGDEGEFAITFGANFAANDEAVVTGVMMCLSCHDGNIAKGAMMTNYAYEQRANLLPANAYGTANHIPTLLGNDGTTAGNYENDHPIGPSATLGAVGIASTNATSTRIILGTCGTAPNTAPCTLANPNNTTGTQPGAYIRFVNHYGSFNVTRSNTATGADPSWAAGGRAQPVVIPAGATDATTAYLVCTTCHTPHSMYTYGGTLGSGSGSGLVTSQTVPSYFFVAAPYNPGAPVPDGTQASSATQFCRQCHFTGAGGSNEGSGINNVTTSY